MSHGIDAVLEVLAEVQPIINQRYGGRLERLIGSRTDSSDLFQAVSMKAIHAIGSFCGETNEELRAWVLSIAGNAYRSLLIANINCVKRSTMLEGPAIGVNTHDLLRDYMHKVNGACPLALVHREQDEAGSTLVVHVPKGNVAEADALRKLPERLTKLVASFPAPKVDAPAQESATAEAGTGEERCETSAAAPACPRLRRLLPR